ncbi:MAG: cold-shock protein [Cellvibrionaceae bacterium]
MPTGTVKWFNNAKGYGFILPDQGGEDLFVHYSSILMDGYKTLKAGQVVSFEVIKGGKGLHATNIKAPDTVAPPSADPDQSHTTAEAGSDQSNDAAAAVSNAELETYS